MGTRRFDDRPRDRRPGAGRPRNRLRRVEGPVDAEIVGAAAHLFAKQGVATTTMAEIADAVGLGVSSIYYYFRSKHDILERIVIDVNRIPLDIAEAARRTHPDAGRRLHAFVRADAEALCGFPFDINEIHRLAGEDPGSFERYWADRQQLLVDVAGFIEQGIEAGDFVVVDPMLAAVTVLANDEAVQNWYRPPAGRPADHQIAARFEAAEIGAFLADMALRSLLVEPGRLPAIGAATTPDR